MLITCIYRFAWQVTAVPNLRHGVTVHKMIYRVIYVTRGADWAGYVILMANSSVWYNFCKSRAGVKWVWTVDKYPVQFLNIHFSLREVASRTFRLESFCYENRMLATASEFIYVANGEICRRCGSLSNCVMLLKFDKCRYRYVLRKQICIFRWNLTKLSKCEFLI